MIVAAGFYLVAGALLLSTKHAERCAARCCEQLMPAVVGQVLVDEWLAHVG